MHKGPDWHPAGGSPRRLSRAEAGYQYAVMRWEACPTVATLIVLWDAAEALYAAFPAVCLNMQESLRWDDDDEE